MFMEGVPDMNVHNDVHTEQQESFEDKIDGIVHGVYEQISRDYPDDFGSNPREIFWQNACQQFSEILREKLKHEGVESVYHAVDMRRLAAGATKPHRFIETDEYYIDGTWQQFLDQPHPYDKYLMLNKRHISEDLKDLGVPEELWFLYTTEPPKLQ